MSAVQPSLRNLAPRWPLWVNSAASSMRPAYVRCCDCYRIAAPRQASKRATNGSYAVGRDGGSRYGLAS
jgi:hypothetical protein